MTNMQMDLIRNRLLTMKQPLETEIGSLEETVCYEAGVETCDNLSNIPVEDRAERGSADYDEIVGIGLLDHARSRMKDIVAALDRIENRTFGQCDRCGCEISKDRLEAIPFARQCIDCARITEPKTDVSPGNL